ncbi:MAG TPA: DUF2243 domain-containing protein [Stellaceae bacterium]
MRIASAPSADLSRSRPDMPLGGAPTSAGFLLGFAMSGFLDGILFHQVLQWHHLLSNVSGSWIADIRVQILADGLFHVAMYVVAAAGLWMLWRDRDRFSSASEGAAGGVLLADFLIGFGVWHIVDAVLFHWILRIHHIRMDSDNYLLWDVLLFALGIVCTLAGWRARRRVARGGGGDGTGGDDNRSAPGRRRRSAAPLLLAVSVLTAGPVAALPPRNAPIVAALFPAGSSAEQVFAAVDAANGRIVRSNATGDLWLIDVSASGGDVAARQLYAHGALYVSGGSLLPIGCLASRGV